MNRSLLAAATLTAFLAPTLAGAGIDESLAREIYVQSGAKQQLEDAGAQFPLTIREAAEQSKRKLPFSADELEHAARRAYDVATTEKVVIAELQSRLEDADAQEVLQWLRGKIGKRLTALEIEVGRPEVQAQMAKYAQTLSSNPPPEERLELIQALDQALRVTDSATRMMMNMSLAIGIGVLDTAPYVDEQAVTKMRESIEAERPSMAETVGPAMFVMLLYAYRDVSDADLNRYIEFAVSPAGDRYQRAMTDGLDRALTVSGLRLGQELSNLVPAKAAQEKKSG